MLNKCLCNIFLFFIKYVFKGSSNIVLMFSLNDKTTAFEKEYQYVYYANCEIHNTVGT